ncbi:MAG: hemolysin III family protein [Saprospiraceae bacterium]
MPEASPAGHYKEEKANALTHAPGILMAIGGTPYLIKVAAANGASGTQIFGIVLFGVSMLVLYLASTIYHSIHDPERKRMARQFDHIAIYFLIAGTHTPFILKYLDNPKGWVYLFILWGLALIGTIGKLAAIGKWDRLSLVLYLFMGWMVVFVLPDIWPVMSGEVLAWIGTGEFFYTAGVFFYTRKKMPYAHALWHLFVLAGTAGHFVALWKAFGIPG